MRPRKKLLLVLASFSVLVAGFLLIEHFRGEWALKRWKARMLARGEELSIDKLAPPIPRAEENGLPQLLWTAGQLGSLPPDLQPPALKYTAPGKCVVITRLNEWHVRDLKRTNINVTWVAIGEQLAPLEPGIEAVLEILQSEVFHANLDYRRGFNLPMIHLTRFKSLAQVLSGALLYDLHQGQNPAAFAKLQCLLAVPNALKDEPTIISQLVRIATMHFGFMATWQALQSEGWSDAQLAAVQEAWSSYDFLASMEKAYAMERAMVVDEYERFRASDQPLSEIFEPPGSTVAPTPSLLSWDWVGRMFNPDQVLTPLWKFAWSRQDELYYCETMQAVLEAQRNGVPLKSGTGVLAAIDRVEAVDLGPYDRLRFIMSRMVIGSVAKAFRRAWLAQATCEIAVTAVALKRYELRHGKLPCSLQALVPEFLPQLPIDHMDGRPLRYCLDSDPPFLLYSVGQDGRDGNGDTAPSATSGSLNYQNSRDLVWPQPASDAEVAIWKALSAYEIDGPVRRGRLYLGK